MSSDQFHALDQYIRTHKGRKLVMLDDGRVRIESHARHDRPHDFEYSDPFTLDEMQELVRTQQTIRYRGPQ